MPGSDAERAENAGTPASGSGTGSGRIAGTRRNAGGWGFFRYGHPVCIDMSKALEKED